MTTDMGCLDNVRHLSVSAGKNVYNDASASVYMDGEVSETFGGNVRLGCGVCHVTVIVFI